MSRKVEAVIADRHGPAAVIRTIEFDTFEQLNETIDGLIKEAGFGKVSIDLAPEFSPTFGEQETLYDIESGLFSPEDE